MILHSYFMSIQLQQLMNHNQSNTFSDPLRNPISTFEQTKIEFIKKIKYFISSNSKLVPQVTRYIRAGFGFVLISPKDQPNMLPSLINETFNCSLQEFIKQASKFGFSVSFSQKTNIRSSAILFLSKQKLSGQRGGREQNIRDQQWEEEEDEFPKEEEVQQVLKEKQQKSKLGFVKPNSLFNKAQSEGNINFVEPRKQDASIQFKLRQQQFCLTPQGRSSRVPVKSEQVKFDEAYPLLLSDRIRIQKQNYEKCSKMIDGAIIELLEAHKGKRIQQKKQNLMEKVVEIYDLLSNSIENGMSVGRAASDRQGKSQQKLEDD